MKIEINSKLFSVWNRLETNTPMNCLKSRLTLKQARKALSYELEGEFAKDCNPAIYYGYAGNLEFIENEICDCQDYEHGLVSNECPIHN